MSRHRRGGAILTWLHTVPAMHGLDRVSASVLAAAWIGAAGAMHLGLPRFVRLQDMTARPLESLGALVLCLPAGLHAAMLGHEAPWLTLAAARRRVRLRLCGPWFVLVYLSGVVAASICGWTAPAGVPAVHVVALWSLWFGGAALTGILLRPDLAPVGALLLGVLATIPALNPLWRNPVYNLELATVLRWSAAATVIAAFVAYSSLWSRQRP